MKSATARIKNRRVISNAFAASLATVLVVGCSIPKKPTETQPVSTAPIPTNTSPKPQPDSTTPIPATTSPKPQPDSTTTIPPRPPTKPQPIPATNLKTDEQVLIFPTNAVFDKTSQRWKLNVHGWVFEPEHDSVWRNGLIKSLALFIGVEEDTPDGNRFEQRSAMFLVDNERDKNVVLKVEQHYLAAPTTGPNGHFEFDATLSSGKRLCHDWLTLRVKTNEGDQRVMTGQVQCLKHQGISVISDIDDTIKDSNVLDKKKLLKKTFLKEFSSVKGMPTVYQHWQQLGYKFHYVSSSPWQLYPVLSDFIDDQSFPRGSMHLKLIRVKDESIFNLLATPGEGKIPTITTLLETYPERRFILVGDSGEKDPDIYATIAKKYPDRIIKIYIHNVTGDKQRIEGIFKGLPRKQWVVFNNSSEILSQQALLNSDNKHD